MKATDRSILVGVAILALIAAFWFLVLSPKRSQVSDLDGQIADVKASLETAQQAAATSEQAKAEYPSNYHNLVVLGKAVPADDDSPSLLIQVQALAQRSGIAFDGLKLSDAGGSAPANPAAETTSDQSAAEGAPTSGSDTGTGATPASATTSVAPATEAAAAVLPLGATVGPAGLPVMPYDLHFTGDFFQMADFIHGLDALVHTDSAGIGVDGRLVTVDGFSLGPDQEAGFPHLVASLHVTTYVSPADEGLTGGASATTPPAPTEAVPPATATPTSTATPTP